MSIGDKIYLPDKRTLDLVKNKVDNIFAIVPTTVLVPEPSPLDKNYVADKGTLDIVKSELDALPIFTPDGTSIESDVLVGKTFLNNSITKKTGTMPNRGAVSSTITTQNGTFTLPSGYHNGTGKITASFANLTPNNILSGVNIGGVVGTAIVLKKTSLELSPTNTNSPLIFIITTSIAGVGSLDYSNSMVLMTAFRRGDGKMFYGDDIGGEISLVNSGYSGYWEFRISSAYANSTARLYVDFYNI